MALVPKERSLEASLMERSGGSRGPDSESAGSEEGARSGITLTRTTRLCENLSGAGSAPDRPRHSSTSEGFGTVPIHLPEGLMVSVSGVRGRVGAPLTPELMSGIAAALGAHL